VLPQSRGERLEEGHLQPPIPGSPKQAIKERGLTEVGITSFSCRIIYLYECINTRFNFTTAFIHIKDLSCFAEKVRAEVARKCLFRGQSRHFILDVQKSPETAKRGFRVFMMTW
jgi:hypothetical protein